MLDLDVSISGPAAGAIIGAIIGVGGILIGLWFSGSRAERQRRRDLHARALAAVLAYGEMPFMIRRRRFEEDEQSAERVRLSDHFSKVKAEVATCQVLLAADGDEDLAEAYHDLVEAAEKTAGQEARKAWNQPAIRTGSEMNMRRVFEKLEEFHAQLEQFEEDLARATLPRHVRFRRWLRGRRRALTRRLRAPSSAAGTAPPARRPRTADPDH